MAAMSRLNSVMSRSVSYGSCGFAHGFVVLSDAADFFYRCGELCSPADEIVIRWDDPALNIDWRTEAPTLSARDATAPLLGEVERLPKYLDP